MSPCGAIAIWPPPMPRAEKRTFVPEASSLVANGAVFVGRNRALSGRVAWVRITTDDNVTFTIDGQCLRECRHRASKEGSVDDSAIRVQLDYEWYGHAGRHRSTEPGSDGEII